MDNSEENEAFIPTRRTLLSRLRDWDDRESWRQFFDTYWRLIFSVCTKAGLRQSDAQDVVQETVLSVAKQMPGFVYDPQKGSFKSWLLQITSRRIADHYRKRPPWQEQAVSGMEPGTAEDMPDPTAVPVASFWDEEWERNLMAVAIRRVKERVQSKQFQIFDLSVMKEWPARDIVRMLHVNRAQVYLAKHRVSKMIKEEAQRLEVAMSKSGRIE